MKGRKLTVKQAAFVRFYLAEANLNATRAALMAGYSPKSARLSGHKNITKVDISSVISAHLDSERATASEILKLFSVWMKGNIGDLFDDSGQLLPFSVIRERGLDRVLKTFKVKRYRNSRTGETVKVTTIELIDPQKACDLLCRAYGLYSRPRGLVRLGVENALQIGSVVHVDFSIGPVMSRGDWERGALELFDDLKKPEIRNRFLELKAA